MSFIGLIGGVSKAEFAKLQKQVDEQAQKIDKGIYAITAA